MTLKEAVDNLALATSNIFKKIKIINLKSVNSLFMNKNPQLEKSNSKVSKKKRDISSNTDDASRSGWNIPIDTS